MSVTIEDENGKDGQSVAAFGSAFSSTRSRWNGTREWLRYDASISLEGWRGSIRVHRDDRCVLVESALASRSAFI